MKNNENSGLIRVFIGHNIERLSCVNSTHSKFSKEKINQTFSGFLILFAALYFSCANLNAATILSRATGNWNNTGTWAGGVVPGAGDSVVVVAPHRVNSNGSRSCRSITILGRFDMGNNNVLTLTGDFKNNGTFNSGGANAKVLFSGNNLLQTISGTATTNFRYVEVNKGSSIDNILNVVSIITMIDNGLILSNGTFKLSSASTIRPFDAAYTIGSNCRLWNSGGNISTLNGDLTLNGQFWNTSGTTNIGNNTGDEFRYATGSRIVVDGGIVNIAASLRPNASGTSTVTYSQSGGTVNCSTYGATSTITGIFDISQSGSVFTMSEGTIVIIRSNTSFSGADFLLLASSSWVTGGTVQIGNAATTSSQTIEINCTDSLYNLTVNTTNSPVARLVSNSLIVKNNVSIASGATLNLNNLNLTVGGNWSRIGTFTPGTGTVKFNLGNAQSITGATTFYRLIINKSDKAITLINDITVTNAMTFTSGIVRGLANLLIVNDNVTVSGASDTSHFKGSVRKVGNDAFTFPIGDSIFYAPMDISAPTSATQQFTGTYFHSSYSNTDSIIGMNNVSTEEYWTLDRAINTDSVNVTLSYSLDRSSFVDPSYLSDLKVARWNGSKWVNHGNGGTSFSSPNGTVVTSYKVTSFSPFTLGSSIGLNPLPVNWIDFKANIVSEKQVDLNWTVSETENTEFLVQKSMEGINWVQIGKVKSSLASSKPSSFQFSDIYPVNGNQYYRIEEVSMNGYKGFSPIIPVVIMPSLLKITSVYPNPVGDYVQIDLPSDEPSLIALINSTGQKVLEMNSNSEQTLMIDMTALEKGVYWIEVISNGTVISRAKVIKI